MLLFNKPIQALILIIGISIIGASALAFDSGCQYGASECKAGPQTARGDWHRSLEHQVMAEYATDLAGLPAEVLAPFTLRAYTDASFVNVEGVSMPSLTPAAFQNALSTQERTIHIADFAQLGDLSYSLWDWASGNETCPIDSSLSTEDCHDLEIHNGVVNSSHFLPQSFETYKHYHSLAMQIARQCGRVAAVSARSRADHIRDAYLIPCERLALLYEAVGQHFLQDSWSMGHMWERWGAADRDIMHDHFSGLAIGATAGLIHGVRSSLQEKLGFLGDFNDALCAPTHEEVRFRYPNSTATHPATGDLYFDTVIGANQPANLDLDGEFVEQKTRFLSCSAQGILEVYRASGQIHGQATPHPHLQAVSPTSEADCFGQRATNAAMKKGAGIDVLWAGFWPYHLEIDSYTATTAVLVGTAASAENYNDMSWWELWRKQSQYRRDLSRIVSRMALYAKMDPNGTQMASGGLGSLMDIQPNGHYVDIGRGVASYKDLDLAAHASNSQNTTLDSTAVTRLFQDAYAPLWCDRYSGASGAAALQNLKNRVGSATNSETLAAACGVCTDVVKRHVRKGTGPSNYDRRLDSVCSFSKRASVSQTSGTFVYQDSSATSPKDLAAQWCGCHGF